RKKNAAGPPRSLVSMHRGSSGLRRFQCSVGCGPLRGRMQRLQKSDQCRNFCWRKIFPVRRHIASALNHLANELVIGESSGDIVERRTALTTIAAQGVAISLFL